MGRTERGCETRGGIARTGREGVRGWGGETAAGSLGGSVWWFGGGRGLEWVWLVCVLME